MTKSILTGTLAGILLACSPAFAQEAAPDAARPEIKTVQDWFVRCFPIQSPSPCDMFQELDSQTTKQRVLSLSLAFVPSMDRYALQITVPLEVSIPKGLVLQTDAYKSPVLKYRRCDRNGCYVEMAVDNKAIALLAKSGPAGKISIVSDNGKSYNLNFSLKGFAQAHDEMAALARTKAKPVEKQGDPAAPATAP